MQNYTAQPGSTVTLNNNGVTTTVDLYSLDGLNMLSNLWIKSAAEHRLNYESTWLGRPVIQFPMDIVAIQELIWSVRPDLIIETGVAHGGSLVLSASILEILGHGKVIGVDIEIRAHNRAAIESHPLAHRIELIEGSSVADETFSQVRHAVSGGSNVMVVLDSNHTEAHVLRELELYGSLVSPGSYMVAHDGAQAWVWDIPRGKAEWRDDHPLLAIQRYLADHPEFVQEERWTRLGITSSPGGWLRKIA